MNLAEKYRPTNLQQLVGFDALKPRFAALMKRGIGGRAFWLSGKSGCGKTTLARILASSIATENTILEYDAGSVTPSEIERLKIQIRQRTCLAPEPRNGWVIILNEAHGLRTDTMRALLVALEEIPECAAWIFTTTAAGHATLFDSKADAGPLVGRCLAFDLDGHAPSAELVARYASGIAQAEGLGGADVTALRLALASAKGSIRALLNRIDAGEFLP
jgi:DNA polymerase-3 subunit gamma/tau